MGIVFIQLLLEIYNIHIIMNWKVHKLDLNKSKHLMYTL